MIDYEAKYKQALKLLYEAWSRIDEDGIDRCDDVADFLHANLKDLEE